MIVFQARSISKSFGDKEILKSVSLSVNDKERVGLIGVNGSGKTTLLRCLTGQLSPDTGEVYMSNLISTGYLEQLPQPQKGSTAWDLIMDSYSGLIEKREMLGKLEKEMGRGGPDLDKLMDRYARLTEEYERADGYACENMARRILVGLGFAVEQFQQELEEFSGGEKTRLNLGRILATAPDMLFLDEPTNHLDMNAVEWLEEYLGTYPGTALVVSHDRMFLERVATRIIELKHGQLDSYPGNYSNYLKMKAQNDISWQRAYEKQQEYIQKTERYIRKFKAGIKSKQARGRESQLKRMERIEKPVVQGNIGTWKFRMQCESGQDVLKVKEISKSFEGKLLLDKVDLSLQKGDRVAMIGPNGCGKSTLLKMINGLVTADEGEIIIGSRVKIGYFSQEYEELNSGNTVLEEIINNFDITIEEARNFLGRMLFTGDDVYKLISNISGGEKGRLSLLKLFLTGANFLVLDEPTNHLDIESRHTVEDILSDFPGTVLLVSHDRYFIDHVATRVAAIENKKIEYYWGNYSYYHEKLQEKEGRKKEEKHLIKKEKRKTSNRYNTGEKEKKKFQRKLQKQLDEIEWQISTIEDRKRQLEAYLSDPLIYNDEEKSRSYNIEYRQVEELLAGAYEQWAMLSEKLETVIPG